MKNNIKTPAAELTLTKGELFMLNKLLNETSVGELNVDSIISFANIKSVVKTEVEKIIDGQKILSEDLKKANKTIQESDIAIDKYYSEKISVSFEKLNKEEVIKMAKANNVTGIQLEYLLMLS